MIKLFIADDHPIVREGLKFVVSQHRDIQVVGEAEDADSTLAALTALQVDVLLLDVSMPGPGVLEVIRRLKVSLPHIRVLVLSVHPEQNYARRVLRAGADGYLPKNYSSQALPSAIRQVHAGRKYVTPALAEELANDLTRGEGQVHEALSNREYEVFLQLGTGKTVNQIAEELGLGPKTVRTYRARILEKTNLRSTAELIFYAVNRGLVTEVDRGPSQDTATTEAGSSVPEQPKRRGSKTTVTTRSSSPRRG